MGTTLYVYKSSSPTLSIFWLRKTATQTDNTPCPGVHSQLVAEVKLNENASCRTGYIDKFTTIFLMSSM